MKTLNRIKKSDDFAKAIHKGNSFRLPSFTVHILKTDNGYTRVGISASTKLGHAVLRNRVKRQVRAMCDNALTYDAQSLDIVIIVKNKFVTSNFNDNESQLRDLFTKHVGV